MALLMLADENFALTASLSGGVWSADLPLTNLTTAPYVSKPARCEDPSNLAKSQFEAALATPRAVNLVALLFHNLSVSSVYRISVAPVGGDLSEPSYVSAWTPVIGRLYDSAMLDWEAPNWWTGQPDADDQASYPPHLWIHIDPILIVSALRIEFDDRDNPDGYIDAGSLQIVSAWSPTWNFERGRELAADPRSQTEEGYSGRYFGDDRRPRRRLTLTLANLSTAEARRIFDMGMRVRGERICLVAPDIDDAAGLMREAFPATFKTPPAPKFTYEYLSGGSVTFSEIMA